MASFIIKRNSLKNTKKQIAEKQDQVRQLMQKIKDVGFKKEVNPSTNQEEVRQVKSLRQLREEARDKRNKLQHKQVKLSDMQNDFRVVREKFTVERKKEMH